MTVKKFKEYIYLKIFERFKNENNSEMLAAITINALRNLNANQRYKLAKNMLTPDLREKLIQEYKEIGVL